MYTVYGYFRCQVNSSYAYTRVLPSCGIIQIVFSNKKSKNKKQTNKGKELKKKKS